MREMHAQHRGAKGQGSRLGNPLHVSAVPLLAACCSLGCLPYFKALHISAACCGGRVCCDALPCPALARCSNSADEEDDDASSDISDGEGVGAPPDAAANTPQLWASILMVGGKG